MQENFLLCACVQFMNKIVMIGFECHTLVFDRKYHFEKKVYKFVAPNKVLRMQQAIPSPLAQI